MKLPRHQLAAYSPISVADCLRATAAALRLASDPRPKLIELLRREYEADDVLLSGSGTQALQTAIAIAAKDFGGNPIVALPAYTCYDVASAAIGTELPIALYDVDPDTLGPRLDSLKRVLKDGARVVVAAPSYGIPIDWESVSELADRYGATIVEDAAQGHGASWRGKKLGTLADISVLSFGRGKGWTGGNGGAVLIRRASRRTEPIEEQTFVSDVKGAAALWAQWLLGRPSVYGIPRSMPSLNLGITVYHQPRRPRAMTRSAAAAALSNVEAARRESARRKEVAALYTDSLMNHGSGKVPRISAEASPGYLRFPVLLDEGASFAACRSSPEDELPDRIRRFGVERGYPMSIGRLPDVVERTVGSVQQWPGAERLVAQIVTLPTHSKISVDDLRKVMRLLDVSALK